MRPRIAITVGPDDAGKPGARAKYRAAVEQAGGEAVLLFVSGGADAVGSALEAFDGLLIPGGKDIAPERYGSKPHPLVEPSPKELDDFEIDAARSAKASGLPTLGICRGIQLMNVAFGGTLFEDIDDQYDAPAGFTVRHKQTPGAARSEPTHPVDLSAGSRLATALGSTTVTTNSLHHQALRTVAYDLATVGKARDGIVEAVESRDEHPFFVGVQWHPEEMVGQDGPSRSLFAALVAKAAERARGRKAASGAG